MFHEDHSRAQACPNNLIENLPIKMQGDSIEKFAKDCPHLNCGNPFKNREHFPYAQFTVMRCCRTNCYDSCLRSLFSPHKRKDAITLGWVNFGLTNLHLHLVTCLQ